MHTFEFAPFEGVGDKKKISRQAIPGSWVLKSICPSILKMLIKFYILEKQLDISDSDKKDKASKDRFDLLQTATPHCKLSQTLSR